MIAALRRLCVSLWLRASAATHQWRAHECEAYIAECARDGLVHSLAVQEWRRQALIHRAVQQRLLYRAAQLQQRRAAARGAR